MLDQDPDLMEEEGQAYELIAFVNEKSVGAGTCSAANNLKWMNQEKWVECLTAQHFWKEGKMREHLRILGQLEQML